MTTHNVGILVKVQLRVVLSFILTISFSCLAISQSDVESSNFLRRYFKNVFGKIKDPSEPKLIILPLHIHLRLVGKLGLLACMYILQNEILTIV